MNRLPSRATRKHRRQLASDLKQAEAVLRELKENSSGAVADPHYRHWASATIASYFSAKSACEERVCDHNPVPCKRWFRAGWVCVRCNRWARRLDDLPRRPDRYV